MSDKWQAMIVSYYLTVTKFSVKLNDTEPTPHANSQPFFFTSSKPLFLTTELEKWAPTDVYESQCIAIKINVPMCREKNIPMLVKI